MIFMTHWSFKVDRFLLRFVIPIFDAGCRYSTLHDLSDSQLMRLHIVVCLLHQLEENQITPEDEKQSINNVPLEY